MLRFFSRRKPKGRKDQRYGSGGGYSNVGNGTSRKPLGPTSKHKMLDCKVIFLDGEDETFPITKKAVGQHLMEQVFYKLDIVEKDYFGLQYTDAHNVPHWLDPTKPVKKQVKIGPPYTFRMRIKFYSSEPNNLREEITRYQFFLQLKQDLLQQRLECSYETSVSLAAYSVQSDQGDFDPEHHNVAFISEFRFVENQNEQFEIDVLEQYGKLQGMTPAATETAFLNKAKNARNVWS